MQVVHRGKELNSVQHPTMNDVFQQGPDRDADKAGDQPLDPDQGRRMPQRQDQQRQHDRRIDGEVGKIAQVLMTNDVKNWGERFLAALTRPFYLPSRAGQASEG